MNPITLKGAALIVLISYVSAATADAQKTRGRAMLALVIGLYGLGFPAIVFVLIDSGFWEIMVGASR